MKSLYSLAVAAALALPATAATAAPKTIAETVKEAGQFTTLLKAAEATGLAQKLAGDGPYTLFAPTDAAFAKLDPKMVEALMKPENAEELAELLKHHIVPGKVPAVDFRGGDLKTLKTARGGELGVLGGDTIQVGDAMIVQADIVASNGIIHIVDDVIVPVM